MMMYGFNVVAHGNTSPRIYALVLPISARRTMSIFILCFTIIVMMTSSNVNIFRVTGHLCREFTGHRWIPRTKASDAELWCFLWSAHHVNKRLGKHSWGWWFETPSRPLWRHCNVEHGIVIVIVISLPSSLTKSQTYFRSALLHP